MRDNDPLSFKKPENDLKYTQILMNTLIGQHYTLLKSCSALHSGGRVGKEDCLGVWQQQGILG